MISVKIYLAKNVLSNPKLIAAASAARVDFTTLWIFFDHVRGVGALEDLACGYEDC